MKMSGLCRSLHLASLERRVGEKQIMLEEGQLVDSAEERRMRVNQ